MEVYHVRYFSMEWKKILSKENGKIAFHSILLYPCLGLVIVNIFSTVIESVLEYTLVQKKFYQTLSRNSAVWLLCNGSTS